jgi:hypothetical protein
LKLKAFFAGPQVLKILAGGGVTLPEPRFLFDDRSTTEL